MNSLQTRTDEENDAPRAEPVNVLVVDDRAEDLVVLRNLLDAPDHNVVTVSSGAEALRRLLAVDFAVILLDVMMPVMDGFELATVIKQRPRSRHTPIIFLTAGDQDISQIYRAYSVGAVDYLAKPLDEAVVRAKVGIFVDLFRKDLRIAAQARALVEADQRERERELAALRSLSEKRYRRLVETIPASVWTADPDGSVNYCNHHWYEQTGLRFEETRGKGWLQAVHPDDAPRVIAGWEAAIAGARPFLTEVRLRRVDGSYRWHLCHAVPEEGEAVHGWLGMFAECEDLKQAINTRDEFLSIASHELRTPLSTLQLQLQNLARTTAALDGDGQIGKRLEVALRQTARLERLIDALLDVGRIAAGHLKLDIEEFDIVEVVRQVAQRFSEEQPNVAVEFDVPRFAVIGQWDRLRVEQVLQNLLSNAVKYGRGRPIRLSLEGGEPVKVAVRDEGIGIDAAHQERIFGRFERAVSPVNFSGLGMGLYITRQIMEAHGGGISVDSKPGAGSVFRLQLPRRARVAV